VLPISSRTVGYSVGISGLYSGHWYEK